MAADEIAKNLVNLEGELEDENEESECRYRKNWGKSKKGIWVKPGCLGNFKIYYSKPTKKDLKCLKNGKCQAFNHRIKRTNII